MWFEFGKRRIHTICVDSSVHNEDTVSNTVRLQMPMLEEERISIYFPDYYSRFRCSCPVNLLINWAKSKYSNLKKILWKYLLRGGYHDLGNCFVHNYLYDRNPSQVSGRFRFASENDIDYLEWF